MLSRIIKFLKKDFIKDVAITTAGQIAIMLAAFALNKIISSRLSVEDFGLYNLVKRSASVITYVMLLAMGIAVPKYLSALQEKKDTVQEAYYVISSMLLVLLSCIICSGCLFLFKNTLSELLFDDMQYSYLVFPMLLFAVASSLATYSYSFFRGIGAYKKYSLVQITVQLLNIIIAVLYGNNVQKVYVCWGIEISIFVCMLMAPVISKSKRTIGKINTKHLKNVLTELIKYGLPRVPGEFVLFAYSLLPLTIVTHKFGLEQAAGFSVAVSLNSMITPLFSFVGVVLLPYASKSITNHETSELKQNIRILFGLYVTVSIVAIIFINMIPYFLIKLLFDAKYIEAVSIVKIVSFALLPNSLYLLYRNPLDGVSKFPYNTVCLTISFGITVLLMLTADTIEKCSWAYVIGYFILGGLSFVMWKKVSKKML